MQEAYYWRAVFRMEWAAVLSGDWSCPCRQASICAAVAGYNLYSDFEICTKDFIM